MNDTIPRPLALKGLGRMMRIGGRQIRIYVPKVVAFESAWPFGAAIGF